MTGDFQTKLEEFRVANKITTKGYLGLVLRLTRAAITGGLPLRADDLVTEGGGQVKGQGKSAVQKILSEYGIDKVLAKEGSRTSRGTITKMKNYVELLNASRLDPVLLRGVEAYWIERIKDFFNSQPFKLSKDKTLSLSSAISLLLAQAEKRQRENPGTWYVGAIMQHLVGAKLELVLTNLVIEHHGFAVADGPTDRSGDFLVGNASIHVTATPTESLMEKCAANLVAGLRPIIVTRGKGVAGGQNLAEGKNLQHRIDIYDVEQFISLNLYEHFLFRAADQDPTLEKFVEIYNEIVDEHETDPSLRIEIK